MAAKTKYRPAGDVESGERKGETAPLFERPYYRREKRSLLSAIGRIVSIFLFMVFCVIVLGSLTMFWVFREDISRDSIRRITSRISQKFAQHAQLSADIIAFDSQPDNVLAPFQDGLAVLTTNRLVCYDAIGGERLAAERSFKRPALLASPENVLAYDRGGTTLLLANRTEFLIDTDWEKPIITARLNNSGWTALVTQGSGYKSVVWALNPDGVWEFKYHSPDYYVSDAALSPNASRLAISCIGFSENWVSGHLRIYDLSLEDPDLSLESAVTFDLGDDTVIELFFPAEDRIVALTEKGLIFWDEAGNLLGRAFLRDRKLLDYSVLTESVVLRTARNHTGTGSRLESYDLSGASNKSIDLDDDIICQSGGGGYVTLVTSDRILVYDNKLEPVSSEPNDTFVRQVLQCDSGSMFFIYNDTARLYTP